MLTLLSPHRAQVSEVEVDSAEIIVAVRVLTDIFLLSSLYVFIIADTYDILDAEC